MEQPVQKAAPKAAFQAVAPQPIHYEAEFAPQDSFLSNCKYQELSLDGDYCVLAWNLVGTVILRK